MQHKLKMIINNKNVNDQNDFLNTKLSIGKKCRNDYRYINFQNLKRKKREKKRKLDCKVL